MMQTTFLPEEKVFTSQTIALIGNHPIHKGDHIKVVERGDGLWNVFIDNTPIGFAIVPDDVNKLAGWKIVKEA
jgi:hypothetical protein